VLEILVVILCLLDILQQKVIHLLRIVIAIAILWNTIFYEAITKWH